MCVYGTCHGNGTLTGDSTMMLGMLLLPPEEGRWRNRWRRYSSGDRVRAGCEAGSSEGVLDSARTGVRGRGSPSMSPRGVGVTISRGR